LIELRAIGTGGIPLFNLVVILGIVGIVFVVCLLLKKGYIEI